MKHIKIFITAFLLAVAMASLQAQQTDCDWGIDTIVNYYPTCNGGMVDNTVTVTATGTPLSTYFSFGWSADGLTGQTVVHQFGPSWTWHDLPTSGKIHLWITSADDPNGCTAEIDITLTHGNLGVSPWVIQPLCSETEGTIGAGAYNAAGDLTYLWSNGKTDDIITVVPGTYTVTVTDVFGTCAHTATGSVTVFPAPGSPTAEVLTTNDTCNSGVGSATVIATGGTQPYAYHWVTSSKATTITGLHAGNYTVTITDRNGCTGIASGKVQNITKPITIIKDTSSCKAITLPWGQVASASGTYTHSDTVGCGTKTTWTVTIAPILSGDTTKVVVCQGGKVHWMSSDYAIAGFYSAIDSTGPCLVRRYLDFKTVGGSDTTVVTTNTTCHSWEVKTEVKHMVTSDGCGYDAVKVTTLITGGLEFKYPNVCEQGIGFTVEHDTLPSGCVTTTVVIPTYVGTPDSNLVLPACNIKFADSLHVEDRTNQAGCHYKITTKWNYKPETINLFFPTCNDSLLHAAPVVQILTAADGCSLIATTHYYPGTNETITLPTAKACFGDTVMLGNQPHLILSDTLLRATGATSFGCPSDTLQYVSVKLGGKSSVDSFTCVKALAGTSIIVGAGKCPDTLEVHRYFQSVHPAINHIITTCKDSLLNVGEVDTDTLVNGCTQPIRTLFVKGELKITSSEVTVCYGTIFDVLGGSTFIVIHDTSFVSLGVQPNGCPLKNTAVVHVYQTPVTTDCRNTCNWKLGGHTTTEDSTCLKITRVQWTFQPDTQLVLGWLCNSQKDTVIFHPDTSTTGCVTVYKNLLLHRAPAEHTTFETICSGQMSKVWNGNTYTKDSLYVVILKNASSVGCDSTDMFRLIVLPPLEGSFAAEICYGGSFVYNGKTYTAAGNYVDTLKTVEGCDSIVCWHLSVLPIATIPLDSSVCEGFGVTFHGVYLNTPGVYIDTIKGNCTTVEVLRLTVKQKVLVTIDTAICKGEFYQWRDSLLTKAGTYRKLIKGIVGCDTMETLKLSIRETPRKNLESAICYGATYQWGDSVLTKAGTYTRMIPSVTSGCDTLATLELRIIGEQVVYGVSRDTTIQCGNPIPPFNTTAFVYTTDGLSTVKVQTSFSEEWIDTLPCTRLLVRKLHIVTPCGFIVDQVQITTIIDTLPPTINDTPPNVTIDSNPDTLLNFLKLPTEITVTDCSDSTTLLVGLETVNDSTLRRIWTASDKCGNTRTAQQIISLHQPDTPACDCLVSVHPNPVAPGVTPVARIKGIEKDINLELIDMTGRERWSWHGGNLRLAERDVNLPAGLTPGLYFLRVTVPELANEKQTWGIRVIYN